MNNFRQQAAAAVAAGQGTVRTENASPMNMNMPGGRMNQAQVRAAQMGMQTFPQQGAAPYGAKIPGQHMMVEQSGAPGAPGMAHPAQKNRNMNALQDYQMQLMLLEKQNKKRLDIARNGSAELQLMEHKSPGASPGLNTKPLPVITAAKVKKYVAAKRGRKPSTNGVTPQASDDSRGTLKKEYTTPLTPATDNEPNKKKRKNGESPKKEKPVAKKDKLPPKKKDLFKAEDNAEFSEERADEGTDYFHASLADGDKMMAVDILGGNGQGENNFFSSGGNSSIDDIEFDFRLFLDGGDNGLNENMNGFNWGNPIEGAE